MSTRRVLVATSVLAGSAVLGWVAGQLWWRWWAPPPEGVVYETTQGLRWLADPVDAGSAQLFSATAEYAVLGAGLGLVVGLVLGVLTQGWEIVGLLLGLLTAALAGWVMYVVGTDLSPPDPQSLAADAGVGTRLPGSLEVAGWSPYLAWPAGVLAGQLAVLVLAPVRPPVDQSVR